MLLAALVMATGTLAGCATNLSADQTDTAIRTIERGVFFSGGRPDDIAAGPPFKGQMYVQYDIPAAKRFPFPIVFIHGSYQSGVNYLSTPDGREGWYYWFLRRGFPVYLVDQVGHGRSGPNAEMGQLSAISKRRVERLFTHPSSALLWPEAALHTQWPGGGAREANLHQFLASQQSSYQDNRRMDELNRDALLSLLDRIGPAVLLTHSRASTFGWLVADARPDLVSAIISVEPHGPPYFDAGGSKLLRPWGIAYAPMPSLLAAAAGAAGDLIETKNDSAPGRTSCWMPREQGTASEHGIRHVPVVIVVAEASYHAQYDHCTAEFLRRSGIGVKLLRLADIGITGNGHMMMLEANNDRIAEAMNAWLQEHCNASHCKQKRE
jgi:pimeloyl-ACP methyl ester carboxylesterase